ncbi:hypothetical protein F4859DRAFT_455285 [Xylaria cf. heliscus]|nr:hypothetical protein F4859DRAFT_455285 [Xylaria cf. heliscus]
MIYIPSVTERYHPYSISLGLGVRFPRWPYFFFFFFLGCPYFLSFTPFSVFFFNLFFSISLLSLCSWLTPWVWSLYLILMIPGALLPFSSAH